jgi:hypothetical protein
MIGVTGSVIEIVSLSPFQGLGRPLDPLPVPAKPSAAN